MIEKQIGKQATENKLQEKIRQTTSNADFGFNFKCLGKHHHATKTTVVVVVVGGGGGGGVVIVAVVVLIFLLNFAFSSAFSEF